ncbi:MAG: hypothetical protein OHK0039_01540 [Bacteroidia bacterium]
MLAPGSVIVLVLVLIVLYLVRSTVQDQEPVAVPPPELELSSGVESFGVVYRFSDSARVSAQLFARHVLEKEEGDEKEKEMVHYLDQGVRLEMLNAYGQVSSTVTADSGEFRRKSESAVLRGNVRLFNTKGERLETDELYWDKQKDSVFTTKPVRIQTPSKIITGRQGLRADASFDSYTLYGIQGEIETEEN